MLDELARLPLQQLNYVLYCVIPSNRLFYFKLVHLDFRHGLQVRFG